ncbi:MAG: HEPN domain-containing protein [Candidatus Hydrogenedentota bacterium]
MNEQLDASSMLAIARRDFRSLSNMTDPELFEDVSFGFFAQQAVEKAFKARIAATGAKYPFTHEILSLVDLLGDLGETVPKAFESLDQFTDFGVQFRYTRDEFSASILDRRYVIDEISKLLEVVQRRIDQ